MGASPTITYGARARRVQVLLPLPLRGAYDYRVPDDLALEAGDFVSVPLGARDVTGVVWDDAGGQTDGIGETRLKDVRGRLDTPPLPADLRRLVDWVANYTLSPPGAVLRMAMSVPKALEPPPARTAFTRGGAVPERLTPARRRVLDVLAAGPPRTTSDLAAEAAVSPSVVRGLAEAGALTQVTLAEDLPAWQPDLTRPGPALSAAQADAVAELQQRVRAAAFDVVLLDGVTGSGKTEVYFEAAVEALAHDRQVLVLLPEIALTAQWLERFEARFGMRPAEWHSDLTAAERRRNWRAIARGRASIVVGARSALFLPFAELGLIIIDEEHDASFKQDEGVIYSARDMSVVRGSLTDCPVVLVSATPSLETVTNVAQERYARRPSAQPARRCRDAANRGARHARKPAAPWPLAGPAAHAGAGRNGGRRRAGDAVSQPARLRPRSRYAAAAATASNVRTARRGWLSTGWRETCNAIIAAITCPIPISVRTVAPPKASRRAGRVWSGWRRR